MKTIIAGSRTILNPMYMEIAIQDSEFEITSVVCGGAGGVDTLGKRWADQNKIPVVYKFPQWDKYGKSAGPRRNEEMGKIADALVAVWDGSSVGTKNMIDIMIRLKKPIYIFRTNTSVNPTLSGLILPNKPLL